MMQLEAKKLQSKASNKAYREGWDRVFGKHKQETQQAKPDEKQNKNETK